MPTFVVSPEDLARSLEDGARDAFANAVDAIRTECKVRAPVIIQRLISGEHPPPVDRGTYRREFHVESIEGGAAVYNSAPHGPIVELGRRAGARPPPLDVIEAWVRRKGFLQGPVTDAKVRSAAYVIARGIARRGLRGHYILARMEQELTPLVMDAIGRALGRPRE